MDNSQETYELLNEIFECKKCSGYNTSNVWMDKTRTHLESIGLIINDIPTLTKELIKDDTKYVYVCPSCKKVCNLDDIKHLSKRVANSLKKEVQIKILLESDKVDYDYFFKLLKENKIGNWNDIITTEDIKSHIISKIIQRINVSALLSVVEQKNHETKHWIYNIENPKSAPIPINSKRALTNALGLKETDLKRELICLL